MSKELTPLQALEYLDDIAHGRIMKYNPHELKIIIEKSLKALEIIKKFGINASFLVWCIENHKHYSYFTKTTFPVEGMPNEEEYELLKEILK